MAKKVKIPKLPSLIDRKVYKTGQTRGADDDVIFQNRVGRNSTVIIPLAYYDICMDNNQSYENGFIVLVRPEHYFDNQETVEFMTERNLVLGQNALLFYETREQWNSHNPLDKGLTPASSRTQPLNGEFVARVPSTTSESDEKLIHGFNTGSMKGAGIRVYEYADMATIKACRVQLEYLYWLCADSAAISEEAGMTAEEIIIRKESNLKEAQELRLANFQLLLDARIVDEDNNTVCPLCLEKLSAAGFYSRIEQAKGRDVPDMTVTHLNLFHIRELTTGEFNHKPYNLGWGHHHCNVVCKDSGIEATLEWMGSVLRRNGMI